MKFNWKGKLTSRKFWAAIISMVTAILMAFNASEFTVAQTAAVMSAFSILIAYIVGEGLTDLAIAKVTDPQSLEDVFMNIDWRQKLTSRKFWAAVVGFVSTLLIAFRVPELTVEQVVSVLSSTGVVIAYIIGEGVVDAAKVTQPVASDEGPGKLDE